MTYRRLQVIVTLLATLQFGGCSTWQQTPLDTARVIPEDVRVTRADGSVALMRNPEVTTDSIVSQTGSLAKSDIRQMEVRRFSVGRTLGMVALVLPIPALIIFGCCEQ